MSGYSDSHSFSQARLHQIQNSDVVLPEHGVTKCFSTFIWYGKKRKSETNDLAKVQHQSALYYLVQNSL